MYLFFKYKDYRIFKKVILNNFKMIKVSDSTGDRLIQLIETDGNNNSFVRVGVESGGCSGLSYKLDFDSPNMMMMN